MDGRSKYAQFGNGLEEENEVLHLDYTDSNRSSCSLCEIESSKQLPPSLALICHLERSATGTFFLIVRVNAETPSDRGVEVDYVEDIFGSRLAILGCGAINLSRLDPSPGHETGEAVRMMVPPLVGVHFRLPTKLG